MKLVVISYDGHIYFPEGRDQAARSPIPFIKISKMRDNVAKERHQQPVLCFD